MVDPGGLPPMVYRYRRFGHPSIPGVKAID
jgi:hypothetical protein